MRNKYLLYWMAAMFILLTRSAAAGNFVNLFVNENSPPICSPSAKQVNSGLFECPLDVGKPLTVGFAKWNGKTSTLTLNKADDPSSITISGDCVGSWIPQPPYKNWNLNPFVDECQPPKPPVVPVVPIVAPPKATGPVLVDEWFADLPWHQKLSTKDSNLIDMPFVMPFAAIDTTKPDVNAYCKKYGAARCMLNYGIVNVMAFHRTDTLYEPGDANELDTTYKQDCSKGDCVQVKLEIQRLHSTGPNTYAAEPATNDGNYGIPSLGFAITESTIFAPWRPWYMGHYCATDYDHMVDSVCYEDYWATQFIAAAEQGYPWLLDRPALFWPQSPSMPGVQGSEFGRFCQTNQTTCSMYLGKVKFIEGQSSVPQPTIDPKTPETVKCQPDKCEEQVNTKTNSLDLQFNRALLHDFVDIGRFPWNFKDSKDEKAFEPNDAYKSNPFIGYFEMAQYNVDDTLRDSTITHAEQNIENIPYDEPHYLFKATTYVLPKQCTQQDLANARLGKDAGADGYNEATIQRLKNCSLNFEVHTNGFVNAWKYFFGNNIDSKAIDELNKMTANGLNANQYGRTMFMYAGIPEQMIPAAFAANVQGGTGHILTHEKMYGSSLYTQYLPMVNPADQSPRTKAYVDDFWHAFFMSNHMNQTPDHFIRGIRGRTLWHNEYRANMMYKAKEIPKSPDDPLKIDGTRFDGDILAHVDFPAGFQKENAKSPYHGNTCDSCHIRNGSGIPVQPDGNLSALHRDDKHGMKSQFPVYLLNPYDLDYTYTNKEEDKNPNNPTHRKQIVTPMKLVLFDPKVPADQCSQSGNTAAQPPYSNKFMNFYGNSFHLNQKAGETATYAMTYVPADSEGFYIVDKTTRKRKDLDYPYDPQRPQISDITTGTGYCGRIADKPESVLTDNWPASCDEVSGQYLKAAIEDGTIGIMQLVGKRLGNTPLIEMIPDAKIKANVLSQQKAFTSLAAGCYGKVAGTRVGTNGGDNYQDCTNPGGQDPTHQCYISRWGWIGDRASLEDQIANAAHVEMNINTSEGFAQTHGASEDPSKWVRYNQTLCGPADFDCQQNKKGNSDITEQEVRDMATYQRWIGIPNRSRYQIATSLVVRGEQVFRDSGCNSCHVIDKIPFVRTDNMLPEEERVALAKLQNKDIPDYPFVSYLGTDLLMHDMGYLSQVAKAPEEFRDTVKGTVNKGYEGYIQKIRTPPLKGLRFNRFVTDSNHNTSLPIRPPLPPSDPTPIDERVVPGCDFLLHDGRACDAIEAAFLHDGPAVKQIGMIGKLSNLSVDDLTALRAFLYSL